MRFLDNKYTKCYYAIIYHAKDRNDNIGYTEKHHIIPKCLGGDDRKDNLVVVTAREHFICHRLLPKMTTGRDKHKMLSAIFRMMHSNQTERYSGTSHVYNTVKLEKANIASQLFSGTGNPFYGVNHTEETKQKIRDARAVQVKNQGTTMTPEAREKLSKAAKGRILTDEHKRKIGLANSGKLISDAQKQRLSLLRIETTLTDIQKQHLSNINRGIPKKIVSCPHCGKPGGISQMKRWHFDNCKFNGRITNEIL